MDFLGFKFFGLQWRAHCFCGNEFGKYGKKPDEECRVACTGNADQICGGGWRNSIYTTGVDLTVGGVYFSTKTIIYLYTPYNKLSPLYKKNQN